MDHGARPARRLDAMQPSEIREIHDLAARLRRERPDRSLIPLHFGEPAAGTPRFIVDAACAALRDGAVFYEDNRGRRDLTEALAAFHGRRHGVDLTPEHFVVTCGAMQAITLTMLAHVVPGDVVINVTPAWPNITEAARLAGADVREVPLRFDVANARFDLDFDELAGAAEACARLRMIVVNSPSNPTGWEMPEAGWARLLALCRRHGACLVADEIYDRIHFDPAPFPSVLAHAVPGGCGVDERLVVINGFSKSYCMTGWRLGYLIAAPDLAARLARMQEFITSHAPSMAQVAAITALRDGEPFVADCLGRYRARRALVLDRLARLDGAEVARPAGGFYVFFRLPGSADSVGFCRDLLLRRGVVLAPGRAFGAGGEGCLRLCFASEPTRLQEAIDRLADHGRLP